MSYVHKIHFYHNTDAALTQCGRPRTQGLLQNLKRHLKNGNPTYPEWCHNCIRLPKKLNASAVSIIQETIDPAPVPGKVRISIRDGKNTYVY